MGRINAVPEGILDLLKSKTDGKNPTDLAEQVVPSLALDAYYYSDRLTWQVTPNQSFAQATLSGLNIPASEIWHMVAWGVWITLQNAGQQGRGSFRYEVLPGTPSLNGALVGGFNYGNLPGTGLSVFYEAPLPGATPLVLTGGTVLAVRNDNLDLNGAAAPICNIYAMYYRSFR